MCLQCWRRGDVEPERAGAGARRGGTRRAAARVRDGVVQREGACEEREGLGVACLCGRGCEMLECIGVAARVVGVGVARLAVLGLVRRRRVRRRRGRGVGRGERAGEVQERGELERVRRVGLDGRRGEEEPEVRLGVGDEGRLGALWVWRVSAGWRGRLSLKGR